MSLQFRGPCAYRRIAQLVSVSLAFASLAAAPASAQVVKYGNLTTSGNFAAFMATMAGFGAPTNTITFAGQNPAFAVNPFAATPLNPNFSPGVTLTAVGDVNQVVTGQGNVNGNPSNNVPGEGPHIFSEFLIDQPGQSSLTISFSNAVSGAGFFLIDYFGSGFCQCLTNPRTLEAFTGANGTGTSLGSFNLVDANFQDGNMLFTGFTSGNGDIGSLVYTDSQNGVGDNTGIDDITFGNVEVQATPEPASILLMSTGLGALAMARRKRKDSLD